MSGKKEREKRREERLRQESEAEVGERRKRLLQLGGGVALVAVVVLVAFIVISQNQGSGTSGGDTELSDVGLVSEQLRGIPQKGTVLGDSRSRTTLIEYGDLQCPICKEYSEEVLPQIISGPVRDGEATIDFRNFTIISQQSVPAGAAALAAGEQGRGWNFIELFYRNQGEERSGYVTDEFLTAIAKGAGVPNLAKWNSDRHSQRLLNEVSRTTEQAENYGFSGTPSFVVKGPNGTNPLGTPGSAESIETAIHEGG